jgi:hypothetical protein
VSVSVSVPTPHSMVVIECPPNVTVYCAGGIVWLD